MSDFNVVGKMYDAYSAPTATSTAASENTASSDTSVTASDSSFEGILTGTLDAADETGTVSETSAAENTAETESTSETEESAISTAGSYFSFYMKITVGITTLSMPPAANSSSVDSSSNSSSDSSDLLAQFKKATEKYVTALINGGKEEEDKSEGTNKILSLENYLNTADSAVSSGFSSTQSFIATMLSSVESSMESSVSALASCVSGFSLLDAFTSSSSSDTSSSSLSSILGSGISSDFASLYYKEAIDSVGLTSGYKYGILQNTSDSSSGSYMNIVKTGLSALDLVSGSTQSLGKVDSSSLEKVDSETLALEKDSNTISMVTVDGRILGGCGSSDSAAESENSSSASEDVLAEFLKMLQSSSDNLELTSASLSLNWS